MRNISANYRMHWSTEPKTIECTQEADYSSFKLMLTHQSIHQSITKPPSSWKVWADNTNNNTSLSTSHKMQIMWCDHSFFGSFLNQSSRHGYGLGFGLRAVGMQYIADEMYIYEAMNLISPTYLTYFPSYLDYHRRLTICGILTKPRYKFNLKSRPS